MKSNSSLLAISILLFAAVIAQPLHATPQTQDPVSNRLLPTGRRLSPAGESITFHGRPIDLAMSKDQKTLLAKDRGHLRVIDANTFKLIQSVASPGGASLYGLVVGPNDEVYFTNSKNLLHVFQREKDGRYKLERSIELGKDSFPCGLTLSDDASFAYVCLSKKNSVGVIDLKAGKLFEEIAVGVAPFGIARIGKNLFVSNTGGRIAREEDKTAPSAGAETVTDNRGVASTGTVSVISIGAGQEKLVLKNEIAVARQPAVIVGNGQQAAVCNANDDSVSFLSPETELKRFDVRPDPSLPFGSMPNSILFWQDKMLVALAGNNAIAVYETKSKTRLAGLIPTGWYPSAMVANETHLFVANIKGEGARAKKRDDSKGMNSHDHLGSIQRIDIAKLNDESQLAAWSKTVRENGRIAQILRASVIEDLNPEIKPIPIPKKLGEPSVFKHVIYVIKENRTFDQIFGDVKEARSDESLCVFPEKITPNHHKLARRFGLLDNYYCNGVLSADGHSWATEANVTPYLERAFGGFSRSYTFGDDPITYSSSGFIWDSILDAGLSFRNYGELDYAKPPEEMKYMEIFKAHVEDKPIEFTQNIGIERLRKFSCREYPGWNMQIPDVLRMDRFLNEFREFEKNDGLPNLSIVYLPQDHFGGGITSRSHMADNDLAVGRLIQAVSKSRYWKDTVVFVNEDDPQNGYDHIDGHRSICLVVSAYSKPGINHDFANQTSVLRTISHIFGLAPLNQQDASAPLMTSCFQIEPDFTPYELEPASIPLNELPKPKNEQSAVERKWRDIASKLPLERTGMKTEKDEDNLNRFIWHEVKGWETPYPEKWAGAHGKGLKELGLKFDQNVDE